MDRKEISLTETLRAIREELKENKAFLQMSMTESDPEARLMEEKRIENVLTLANVMEEILDNIIENEFAEKETPPRTVEEEIKNFEDNLEKRKAETEEECYAAEEEFATGRTGKEEPIDLRDEEYEEEQEEKKKKKKREEKQKR